MKKGLGIRTRLWLIIVGFTLLVAIFIYVGQIFMLNSYFGVSKKATLEKIAEQIENGIETGNIFYMNDIITNFAYNDNLCIEISDRNGVAVQTVDMMGSGCVIHSIDRGTLEEIKSELLSNINTRKFYNIVHPKFKKTSILYGKALSARNNTYFVFINAYLAPVSGTMNILRSQLLMTAIFVIVAGAIVAFLVAQTFTRPIRKLKEAAGFVAKGDFSTKVPIERNDELGDLAETFNYMTAEVSKVDVLQKDLIANVSHELRIPLTMIKGYAETIRDISGENKEKREEQLGIIIEESDRLNELVSDILNLGRIESGQERLEYEEIPIKEMLEGIKQKYESLYSDFAFKLDCGYEGSVSADAGKITQVIMNLINNAMNHSDDIKEITISLAEEENRVCISIGDKGSGIKKEELPLIWDRYYKSNRSGKRRVAGTGLGLSIVKAIMMAHKMPFGVDSKLGEGSNFWFCLEKK